LPYIVAPTRLTFPRESHTVLAMRRFGLTLIELILVIGIIAVVFALLAPSLQRARLQAKAVVCMSNIRQLNTAFSAYVAVNGKFPYGFDNTLGGRPPGGYAGNNEPGGDRAGWWWFNCLKDVYKNNMGGKTVLQCPSKQIQNSKLKNNILCGNYGANLSICRMSDGNAPPDERGQPKLGSEVSRPAQTLLIVDSGYAIISWRHAADSFTATLGSTNIEDTAYVPGLSINRQRQLRPEQKIDALYGRHPQMTVNVGFADGHVARTKADDLLVKKASDGHYENRSPLWTPDSK
jgi:prepilin-type processing-associated H-X9-DG protein